MAKILDDSFKFPKNWKFSLSDLAIAEKMVGFDRPRNSADDESNFKWGCLIFPTGQNPVTRWGGAGGNILGAKIWRCLERGGIPTERQRQEDYASKRARGEASGIELRSAIGIPTISFQ